MEATFELNDTLYARALVPPTEEVYLWLGANVMLAYPIDEAETLLDEKLSGAKQTLSNCEEDLDFLREQITVRLSAQYGFALVILIMGADVGGCDRESLQLGRDDEKEREGRRWRGGRGEEERSSKWLKGAEQIHQLISRPERTMCLLL